MTCSCRTKKFSALNRIVSDIEESQQAAWIVFFQAFVGWETCQLRMWTYRSTIKVEFALYGPFKTIDSICLKGLLSFFFQFIHASFAFFSIYIIVLFFILFSRKKNNSRIRKNVLKTTASGQKQVSQPGKCLGMLDGQSFSAALHWPTLVNWVGKLLV